MEALPRWVVTIWFDSRVESGAWCRLPGHDSWICHLPAGCPWRRLFPSESLPFLQIRARAAPALEASHEPPTKSYHRGLTAEWACRMDTCNVTNDLLMVVTKPTVFLPAPGDGKCPPELGQSRGSAALLKGMIQRMNRQERKKLGIHGREETQ